MAAVDRTLYGNPLYAMDYHQSPNPLTPRSAQPGVLQSPYLTAAVNELNQVAGRNLEDAPCNGPSLYYPRSTVSVANNNPFLGHLGNFQNLESAPKYFPKVCNELPLSFRKKHKRLDADFDCPLKKRRLVEPPQARAMEAFPSTTNVYTAGDAPKQCWNAALPQVKGFPVSQYPDTPAPADMNTVHSEEMDEVGVESLCAAAHTNFEDIENRLIDIKEVEPVNKAGVLPKLILSDILKESLKNGFEESLTKKIVDSMSRPSMELVLWKPQPEYLGKLQSVSRKCKKDTEARKRNRETSALTFVREVENNLEMANTNSDMDTMWCREEEEMEL